MDRTAEEFGRAAEELLVRTMAREEVQAGLAAGFSQEAWDLVAETGWAEVLVPEAYGGLGLGAQEIGPIFHAVGRHLLPGPLLEHAALVPLLLGADQPSWSEALERIRSGASFLAAPGFGASRAASPRLMEGRLVGSFRSVRFGGDADYLFISGTGEGGRIAALVPTDRGGVEVSTVASLDPIVPLADVAVDIEVEPDEVVIDGAAATLIESAYGLARLMIGCELVGLAERAHETAVIYAKERHQFGKPIGAFQAVQHLLAESERELHGIRCLCQDSLAAADQNPDRRTEIGEVVKAGCSSAARSIVEVSLQVHGGIGFTKEHPLHRYYSHALALEALCGTSRELSRRLGRKLIGSGHSWSRW